jgi:uncharacterized protein
METNTGGTTKLKPLPWGFWATIGFTSLIIILFSFAQFAAVKVFYTAFQIFYPGIDLSLSEYDGLHIGISTCMGAPIGIALALLFAGIRKNITTKEYFCFFKPGKGQYLKWTLAVLALAFCSDAVTTILGKPIVPEFMIGLYKSAGSKALLWFAFIVASPLSEEIIFRGFLFKGIQSSSVGTIGAVIITSIGWTALHAQYDLYGMGTILASGLLLGIARLRTNSIFIPIIMHSISNFIATLETAVYADLI